MLKSQRVESLLFLPVTEKYWQQHQLWDGTYSFADWIDIVDVILTDMANKTKYQEYQKRNSKLKG